MLVGEHGVGKTAQVKEIFDEMFPDKWLYFSGSTMDPWVDFIGVPKEKTDENGEVYLDLVRPKAFVDDSVQAIFMDEFNRSHKKVRNALMELIQFKSINGRKFKNLRVVWAAINPDTEDDIYDVEKADPAQKDRFHIHIEVPYVPDLKYFTNKYGENGAVACEWWDKLPPEHKKAVSPRRLDYMVDIHNRNGDIRDVVDKKTNPAKLLGMFKNGSFDKKLLDFFEAEDKDGATKYLSNENNYAACVETIIKKKDYTNFFLPLIEKEKIISLCAGRFNLQMAVLHQSPDVEVFKEVVDHLKKDAKVARVIEENIRKNHRLDNFYNQLSNIYTYKDWGSKGWKPKAKVNKNSDVDSAKIVSDLALVRNEKDTYKRWKVLFHLADNMPMVLSPQDKNNLVKIIEIVVDRSHTNTITGAAQKDVLLKVFNHVLDEIANSFVLSNPNMSFHEILEILHVACPPIIRKFEEARIHQFVNIPDVVKNNKRPENSKSYEKIEVPDIDAMLNAAPIEKEEE